MLCRCGCGSQVTSGRHFLRGHNTRMMSPETRMKMGEAHKGKARSPETRKKISIGLMGNNNTKGKPWSEARRAAQKNRRKHRPVSNIRSIHRWVAKNRIRTGVCERCKKEIEPITDSIGRKHVGTVFANISGEYKLDVDDYKELCRPCHILFDMGL